MHLWNTHRGTLAEALDLTPKRERQGASLLAKYPDQEWWLAQIARAAASPFCTGGGPKGWRFDFDDLLNPNLLVRLAEGRLHDVYPATKAGVPDAPRRHVPSAAETRKALGL
jgi:hypothetical protein